MFVSDPDEFSLRLGISWSATAESISIWFSSLIDEWVFTEEEAEGSFLSPMSQWPADGLGKGFQKGILESMSSKTEDAIDALKEMLPTFSLLSCCGEKKKANLLVQHCNVAVTMLYSIWWKGSNSPWWN